MTPGYFSITANQRPSGSWSYFNSIPGGKAISVMFTTRLIPLSPDTQVDQHQEDGYDDSHHDVHFRFQFFQFSLQLAEAQVDTIETLVDIFEPLFKRKNGGQGLILGNVRLSQGAVQFSHSTILHHLTTGSRSPGRHPGIHRDPLSCPAVE